MWTFEFSSSLQHALSPFLIHVQSTHRRKAIGAAMNQLYQSFLVGKADSLVHDIDYNKAWTNVLAYLTRKGVRYGMPASCFAMFP